MRGGKSMRARCWSMVLASNRTRSGSTCSTAASAAASRSTWGASPRTTNWTPNAMRAFTASYT